MLCLNIDTRITQGDVERTELTTEETTEMPEAGKFPSYSYIVCSKYGRPAGAPVVMNFSRG